MQHPFEALKGEYATLLAGCVVTHEAAVMARCREIIKHKAEVAEVCAEIGMPIAYSLASFELEASSDFSLSPAQGDPLNERSTHVPKNRGPFKTWAAAALDAYHIDGLDAVGAANWSWERACFEGELFNGFGYRAPAIHEHTPYLWSYTNVAQIGKFTSDGHWEREWSTQIGLVALMKGLIAIDPSLDLTVALPTAQARTVIAPAPNPAPVGVGGTGAHGVPAHQDTLWIQQSLNKLFGRDEIDADGSYGRETRAFVKGFQEFAGVVVDGFVGPQTIAAIENRLGLTSAQRAQPVSSGN